MKIAHAVGWYFPESLGGTEVYVASLAKRLREHGFDNLIVAPDARRDEPATYRVDDIEVFRYPIPRSPTRDEVQGRSKVRGTEYLHRWLERVRPDVFHCHTLLTGLGLAELELAKELGATIVNTCHTPSLGFICQRGTMMHHGEELCDGLAIPKKCAACELENRGLSRGLAETLSMLPPAVSRLGGRVPGRLGTAVGMVDLIRHNADRQRELLASVDAFVVLTEWARAVVERNHGTSDKLVINRLGIELGSLPSRKRSHEGPVRFGFVGRLHVTKGIFVLVEALSRLPPELPFTLELRGPDGVSEIGRLKELLAHDPRIRFAPAVEHDEISGVLVDYDVLLCPSIWLEGGPTVAMEAQAVGTPVVGSRIGGLAEIIDDGVNGRLVPPADVDALSLAVTDIVSDPEVVERWRRSLPKHRTMDDVTRDYVSLYERYRRN